MCVYLLHFDKPVSDVRHFLGFTHDLEGRLLEHAAGSGAVLLRRLNEQKIDWSLVRTWPAGDRRLERKLKRWHGAAKLCPVCDPANWIKHAPAGSFPAK